MIKKLLIATNNPGKQREIQNLLRGLKINLIFPEDAGIKLKVDESADTYSGNALLKARAFSQVAKMLSLADDSGLEVEALGGLPGLQSARLSPKEGASDADRRMLLLELLADYPHPWTARFRCIVALVTPDGVERVYEGICPGVIIPKERGRNGFGYDPIFLLPEYGRTMAELTMKEKNKISHRARAITSAQPEIMELLALS